jgi:hypothetical protein
MVRFIIFLFLLIMSIYVRYWEFRETSTVQSNIFYRVHVSHDRYNVNTPHADRLHTELLWIIAM